MQAYSPVVVVSQLEHNKKLDGRQAESSTAEHFYSMEFDPAAFRKSLSSLVEKRFGGDNKKFATACKKLDEDAGPSDVTVGRYLDEKKGTLPKLNSLAVMAEVLRVSLDELAGIKKPQPPGPEVGANLLDMTSATVKEPSVETREVPRSAIRPGYAFGSPGHYQLVIDFLVLGPDEREVIPFGKKRDDSDDES